MVNHQSSILMTYPDCLTYLADLGHELRGVKFDLKAIRCIMTALGEPQNSYPTIIVAGTNGKGSTSAMLASILQQAGFHTGLYTSPHLVRVNERIRVSGQEISDDDFALAFSEVREIVDRLIAEKVLPHRPSFFEFLTAVGFLHFAHSAVDFAVLEVGMGGRLDATNITQPRIAVITNVELDHMEFLGHTHAAIAGEKAGVIVSQNPVVSACEHPDAIRVVRLRASDQGAALFETSSFARVSQVQDQSGRYIFDAALNGHRFSDLELPLSGKFQIKNALAALTAAWRLAEDGFTISEEAMAEGLKRARWPGRLEAVSERPLILLDGAHNPAAAREIASFVREELSGRRLKLVYASMRDKEIGEISELLFPLAAEVYLTQTAQARAATPQEVLSAARYRPEKTVLEPDPVRALEMARRDSTADDVILVAGSLFLVGAIKAIESSGSLSH